MDKTELVWRNVSTPNLRDFVGTDGGQDVARIHRNAACAPDGDWRWSVYAIEPARPSLTHGYEADPKEARRKVEAAWAYAKAHGTPLRTAVAEHLKVLDWAPFTDGRP